MDIELYYTPHTRSSRPRWLPELLENHPPLLAYTQRVTARPAYRRAIEPINETA